MNTEIIHAGELRIKPDSYEQALCVSLFRDFGVSL